MKAIFGAFCIIIMIINTLGYVILNHQMKKQTKILQAGQTQIAGFIPIPTKEKTGPLSILNKVRPLPQKERNIELKEKAIK